MTDEPQALIERRGHVLVLTLNRPAARNALSAPMMAIMKQAWDQVDSDADIRVAVLTGAGGAFCAGSGGPNLARLDALLKGRRLTKPLIAAVEGPAIAGGTEILQATDVRI